MKLLTRNMLIPVEYYDKAYKNKNKHLYSPKKEVFYTIKT